MIADLLAASLTRSLPGTHTRDPALIRMFGGSPMASSGAAVNTRTSLGYSPIFRAVNLIGNAVAKCRPHIYRRTGVEERERDTRHPSWRATVRHANALMSAGQYRKTLTAHAMLEGNGIGYVVRDPQSGGAAEYIPLLPHQTGMAVFDEPIREGSPFPAGGNVMYWTVVDGQTRMLEPENIIHIRNLTYNGVWGLSVVELMRETLGLGIAARDAGARFFGQGMLSSGVLYMPPGMRDEDAQQLFVEGVRKQAQGLAKAHRMLVLEEGAKYEKMTVDPEVAQALETREFSVREVANIIGCQPHKLGDTKRTSYASLEQANQEHLDDDIDPWLTAWEDALERVALREAEIGDETHFIEFNRQALVRTNLSAQTAHLSAGRQWGAYSANDWRKMFNLGPIDGGDVYLSPSNMVPSDQVESLRDAGEEVDDDRDDDDPSSDDEQDIAANYRALASHEISRLAKRLCREAVDKSASGADFLEFLDAIPSKCQSPQPLREQLLFVGRRIAEELRVYTEAPYAARDLRRHITEAEEAVRTKVIQEATEKL